MNQQEQFWAGGFGDDYTRRNKVDWRARIPFWRDVMEKTGARSAHEVGCNAGWNLSAIRAAVDWCCVTGHDLNISAVEQAIAACLDVEAQDTDWRDSWRPAELVFTAGVLIHIGPEDIQQMMRRIFDNSYRYVLAVEYADDQETEVEYRGHSEKLWRRPYGKMYQDMGLKLVKEWDAGASFDRCTAWLLEKQ